jgi:hypothetical protein
MIRRKHFSLAHPAVETYKFVAEFTSFQAAQIAVTADPSTALGMTKERTQLRSEIGCWSSEPQIPPLRFHGALHDKQGQARQAG